MLSLVAGVTLLVASAAMGGYYALRHIGLAALATMAPLPGLAVALGLVPLPASVALRLGLAAYAEGFGPALVLAGAFAVSICNGEERNAAVRDAYRRFWLPLVVASLGLVAVLVAAGLSGGARAEALCAAALAIAANSSALGCFYFARFLPCREDFVTGYNRAGERWRRLADGLMAVAQPRWGYTVSGIALVFAAIGIFGARASNAVWPADGGVWIAVPIMVALALAALFGAIRAWRTILSTALTLPVPVLVGLWGLARTTQGVNAENLLLLVFAVGAGTSAALAAGAEAGRYGRSGDDAAVAAGRIWQGHGRGLFFAGTLPALMLLLATPWIGRVGIALAVATGFAGAGAWLFRPAFAAVIEAWLPRAATRASRYRLP